MFLSSASETCFNRCVQSYGQGAFEKEFLNAGEQNCVDRCISKYHQVVQVMDQIKNKPI